MSTRSMEMDLPAAAAGGLPAGSQARVGDCLRLLKPRVMSLVVFSGFAGLYVAPGEIHPLLAAVAVLCIAVAAGAAGAINMWYDRDIDAVMSRTRGRPIPIGRVLPDEALAFGVTLNLFAVAFMGLAVNWVAAALLALASGFYVFVYTMWLKRRTPQNIVIGGAAGAFPPMIGWAAVTGSVELGALALFFIIFIWTPPHFWALALYRDGDYGKAGIPMLPVVSGREATRRQILAYSFLLLPLSLLPILLVGSGAFYGGAALLLGMAFVMLALRVYRRRDDASARQLFGYSILYLFALFAALIVDRAAAFQPLGSFWGGS